MKALEYYYDALDRLVKGEPINVPKTSKINLDTVALEAGRKRGSIKKSRPSFAGLIFDIESAAMRHKPRDADLSEKLKKAKEQYRELKLKYLDSLNREIMLSNRVRELEAIIEADNVYKMGSSGSK